MQRRKTDALATVIGIILIGALIQCAGALKHERLVFPDTLTILRAFFRLLGKADTYRMMGTTVLHLAEALLIASLIGVPLGIAEGVSPFARRLFQPMVSFIRAIPMIVLIIMIMVLSEYRFVPVIAAALMLIPPVSEATAEGCRSIPQELTDVYRMNANPEHDGPFSRVSAADGGLSPAGVHGGSRHGYETGHHCRVYGPDEEFSWQGDLFKQLFQ